MWFIVLFTVGVVSLLAGSEAIDSMIGAGAADVDGDRKTARLGRIRHLECSSDGKVVVACDQTNYRIKSIDCISGAVSTLAGNRTASLLTDGDALTSVLGIPSHAVFDRSSNDRDTILYISLNTSGHENLDGGPIALLRVLNLRTKQLGTIRAVSTPNRLSVGADLTFVAPNTLLATGSFSTVHLITIRDAQPTDEATAFGTGSGTGAAAAAAPNTDVKSSRPTTSTKIAAVSDWAGLPGSEPYISVSAGNITRNVSELQAKGGPQSLSTARFHIPSAIAVSSEYEPDHQPVVYVVDAACDSVCRITLPAEWSVVPDL